MVGEIHSASRHVGAGAVVFRQGEVGDEMFFIISGGVSLRLGEERELALLGPGEFFGELALLGDAPRTATAVTIAETTLLGVRRETFALMMQDDLAVVYRMLDALGRRLSATDRQMHELTQRADGVRIGAHVLAACLASHDPLVIDAASIGRAVGVSSRDAEAIVRAFAGRGIGQLDGSGWCLDPRVDATRLAAALADEG